MGSLNLLHPLESSQKQKMKGKKEKERMNGMQLCRPKASCKWFHSVFLFLILWSALNPSEDLSPYCLAKVNENERLTLVVYVLGHKFFFEVADK
jgi:hypothetical protein